MARVVSVNISEKKGTLKKPVPEIELKLRHGIVGDAHAGDWHRQISLLAEESIDTIRALSPVPLDSGIFAENINTTGIDLKHLPVGTHLRIGETEVVPPPSVTASPSAASLGRTITARSMLTSFSVWL